MPLREKSDDTNVRLSSIAGARPDSDDGVSARASRGRAAADDPAADPAAAGLAPAPPTTFPAAAATPPNVSPQRTYDSAYSDYAAGQHDLAIVGSRRSVLPAPHERG